MRTRHKPPSLVSMWMLDVFCCALGCVLLLLLLKFREANTIAEESEQIGKELVVTQTALLEEEGKSLLLTLDVNDRDKRLALLTAERDETARRLALVREQFDAEAKQLALTRTKLDETAKNLAAVEQAVKATESNLATTRTKADETAKQLALARERFSQNEDELAKKAAEVATLSKKLADTQKSADDLQRLLREKEKSRADALRATLDLSDRVTTAEAKAKTAEKRVSDLEKQLADANVQIVDLQGTKAKLADKIDKLQIESDQRFAGIAMTGRNVVFMVDMSGSMDRIDENTVDPSKWPTVRDTLLKVMRSLPDLQRFQVLLFSTKVTYMLGDDGHWIGYEREKSIERVRQAMTATKPVGDTNLYAAFDEAFKFRDKGMDTIYLISDGLPTSGPGLTPTEDRTITGEAERGVILARHLRRTLRTYWNTAGTTRPKVRINAVGFFYESPDVGAFLWALARENDGSFVGMSRP